MTAGVESEIGHRLAAVKPSGYGRLVGFRGPVEDRGTRCTGLSGSFQGLPEVPRIKVDAAAGINDVFKAMLDFKGKI